MSQEKSNGPPQMQAEQPKDAPKLADQNSPYRGHSGSGDAGLGTGNPNHRRTRKDIADL